MLRIRLEDLADLRDVRLRIAIDLVAAERRSRFVSARWIAHARRVIADDQDGLVPPILELTHHLKRHRVAERDIRRRWIHPQLDAQRLPRGGASFELLTKVLLTQNSLASAAKG